MMAGVGPMPHRAGRCGGHGVTRVPTAINAGLRGLETSPVGIFALPST
jgi:hypothetical protein